MADQKKISSSAGGKDLEKWLQAQLDAAGTGMAEGPEASVEKDDPFYQDAMDGLEKFSSTREIYKHTTRVNRALQKKTGTDRKKNPFEASPLFWFVVAIIVIITVIILGFIVLRMRMGQI